MNCRRCNKELTGKQKSYCCPRCSKLHLKSIYRQRNKVNINKYNREYARRGVRGSPSSNNIIRSFKQRNPYCAKCGSIENLDACHIKPRNKAGKNQDNLIMLCRTHHHQFDDLLRKFWK